MLQIICTFFADIPLSCATQMWCIAGLARYQSCTRGSIKATLTGTCCEPPIVGCCSVASLHRYHATVTTKITTLVQCVFLLQHIGEGPPRRDGAQVETMAFTVTATAIYLLFRMSSRDAIALYGCGRCSCAYGKKIRFQVILFILRVFVKTVACTLVLN